jgi:protein required for attachment to host cells
MSIWILIADASRAVLYSTEKRGDEWEVIDSYSHPESRQKNAELTPTEPGHSLKSKGGARHTVLEAATSPKQAEMEHFAQQLADVLAAGTAQHSYDSWVLVAPPHFLGLLRERLSTETGKRLAASINKDFTFTDAHDARRRLEDAVFPAGTLKAGG